MKYLDDNILVIGDTHEPFTHKNYLDFCCEIRDRVKCGRIQHTGDLVDNHAISYHEHDPDGYSPHHEMRAAIKNLKKWQKAFPKLQMTIGNHDSLIMRKGKTHGLPSSVFRTFNQIFELPDTWEVNFEFYNHGVRFIHGTGYGGKMPHIQVAYDSGSSCAIGHLHAVGGVEYIKTRGGTIFGLCASCGIDREKYAFAYGKDFRFQPIIGCGVITDRGRYAQFFPMKV